MPTGVDRDLVSEIWCNYTTKLPNQRPLEHRSIQDPGVLSRNFSPRAMLCGLALSILLLQLKQAAVLVHREDVVSWTTSLHAAASGFAAPRKTLACL